MSKIYIYFVALIIVITGCQNPEKHEHLAVNFSISSDITINSIKIINFSNEKIDNVEIYKNNEENPFIIINTIPSYDDTMFKRKEYIPKITLADKLVVSYEVNKKKYRCVYYLSNSYKYDKKK